MEPAERTLSHAWWTFALRGAAGIVFGLLALFWPGLTLLALVALFAAYALVGGVAVLAGALRHRGGDDWWPGVLLGAVSIGAAAVAILHPGLTALVLVLLIGANALVAGVLDILLALRLRLRRTPRAGWLLGLAGIASLVFGLLVFLFPGAGALAMVWLVGAWALATGALLLVLALRLRAGRGTLAATVERRVHPDRRAAPAR